MFLKKKKKKKDSEQMENSNNLWLRTHNIDQSLKSGSAESVQGVAHAGKWAAGDTRDFHKLFEEQTPDHLGPKGRIYVFTAAAS